MATLPKGCREALAKARIRHIHTIRMKTHAITTTSLRRSFLAGAFLALTTITSHAAIIMTFQEVGANVVATATGSANLAALTFLTTSGANPRTFATSGATRVGNIGLNADLYTGVSGPTSFGIGGQTLASSGTGGLVGINGQNFRLEVPQGYISGTALSSSATYNGQTFATIGITPGTSTWTWGSGANADSLTVQTGPVAAVPEPGSALAGLLALGVCLSGLAGRSRRQSADA